MPCIIRDSTTADIIQAMQLSDKSIPWGRGIFRRTKRITLELSNLCVMAGRHTACPLHGMKETRILSDEIVRGVLRVGQKYGFTGVVAFHMYNEPTHDPRLVYFIRLAKEMLPGCRIYLLTNGWYLDRELANELVGHGVDFLDVSSYRQSDYARLKDVQLPIPYRVLREPFDDRLSWYGQAAADRWREACYCPLYDISIDSRGRVVLCSYDWRRSIVFGDLHAESLEEIMRKGEMESLYEELSKGVRRLTICAGCPRTRGEAFDER